MVRRDSSSTRGPGLGDFRDVVVVNREYLVQQALLSLRRLNSLQLAQLVESVCAVRVVPLGARELFLLRRGSAAGGADARVGR